MRGTSPKIYSVARRVVPDVGQVARRPLDGLLGVGAFGVVAHAREVAIDRLAARQAVLMQRLPLTFYEVRFFQLLNIHKFIITLMRELVESLCSSVEFCIIHGFQNSFLDEGVKGIQSSGIVRVVRPRAPRLAAQKVLPDVF